ncbi:MAG: hypothetical protein V4598_08130 [Bdellovibrionota bacterium]
MVGLKSVWVLLFSLFLFGACVPSKKQTECGSNEAFNSQLRSCVPIVQGPSAFINVSSFVPLYTSTRYKNDATPVTFTIAVSNPYNQSYTIEWDLNYNGSVTSIAGNVLTTTFIPVVYSTQVGSNVITAKIISGGAVVDSHNFEVVLQETPRPNINTGSITPADYNPILFPDNTGTRFSFTGRNNGATGISNYRVFWTLTKNGVNVGGIYSETDTFTNVATNGTNVFMYGLNDGSNDKFKPSVLGVGNFVLRTRMEDTVSGETVAEHQWNITVQQPPLENISATSIPAVGLTTTSYHATNYSQFNTYNFVYSGTTQSDFCVTIDDGDGTYDGDGLGVQVKWYLEGLGGDICTKETADTNGPQTLCLVDATNCSGGAPFDTTLLSFSNTSGTLTQNHSVVARVYDRAINTEYASAQVAAPPNQYPISWTVVTKPQNSPPTVGFGTTQPTGCVSAGTYSRTGCTVTQGTNFTVSFTVTDDFYSPAVNTAEFMYDVILKKGTNTIAGAGCTKAYATPTAYGTQYTCTMNVPHYDTLGVVDPTTAGGAFKVEAVVTDFGSPINLTPASSQTLSWTLVVAEANPSTLAINPQQSVVVTDSNISRDTPLPVTVFDTAGTNFATELQTVVFRANVDDAERDNLKMKVSLCTDGALACATSTPISTGTAGYINFLRSAFTDPTLNPAIISFNYLLPEDLLLQIGQDVGTGVGTERPVYFKVDVSDAPTVGTTTVKSDSEIFRVYVRNYNPAPTWAGTVNPAFSAAATPSTYYDIVAGVPITLDPGTATDTSTDADENTLYYDYFVSDDLGATWNEIPRTNDLVKNLIWTPDSGSATPIYVRACVGDRANANAAVIANAAQCVGDWIFNVKDGVKALAATGLTDQHTSGAAVWHDTFNPTVFYTAYAGVPGVNNTIYVEKSVIEADGDIDTTSFATVSFGALAGGGATAVIKDISITGTANDLYISYLASSAATPATLVPRLRRIDKEFDSPVVSPPVEGAKENMSHNGKFGFDHDGYAIVEASAAVAFTADALNGTSRTITFTTAMATGETLSINGYVFTAAASPAAANQICDTSSCASGALAAENLADKINTSTDVLLQGITASAAGGVVTLNGSLGGDFLDWDGSISGVGVISSAQAGKSWIANSRWHIPIINLSLGGQQSYVSILSGPVNQHLQSTLVGLDESAVLNTGKTLAFSNGIGTSGEIIIARISGDPATAGYAYLHRFAGASPHAASAVAGTETNPQAIFATRSFQSIKLAPTTTGNIYHYVIAKERDADGGEWNIGRYGSTFLSGLEYYLEDRRATGNTLTVVDNTAFVNPEIVAVPGSSEARMFFISDGEAAGDYFPRIGRLNSSMIFSCGDCFSITTNEVSATGVVGISDYVADVTLGDVGATLGENVNDTVFSVFNVNNGANQKPYTGVINVEVESIQSTSVDVVNHLYRPPYVK